MARNGMLDPKYARLVARLALKKLRLGRRLRLDGLAFVGPGSTIQGKKGRAVGAGRWSWPGHG